MVLKEKFVVTVKIKELNCKWATRKEQGRNKRNNITGIEALMTKQYRWQLKMKLEKRCVRCGKDKDGTSKLYCINCTIKVREHQRIYIKAKKVFAY